MPTIKQCGYCEGTGYLVDNVKALVIDLTEDAEEAREIETPKGERCPFCVGKGYVLVIGNVKH